jgi:CyaY protein
MLNEQEFRRAAEAALDALTRHLMAREAKDGAGFEVEQEGGVLYVLFEEPAARFVITSNAPVRQIWISALITSFKLEWDHAASAFILPGAGEQLAPLVDRLIAKQLEG